MNQIGTPLPTLSPQGGERVAEGRERGGSWRGSGRLPRYFGGAGLLASRDRIDQSWIFRLAGTLAPPVL